MVQPSELLQCMEQEARLDLQAIDVPPELEAALHIGNVQQWYFETEKLIRVLANTLPSTMSQPINQLRYAGHHVLKATAEPDDAEAKFLGLIFQNFGTQLLLQSHHFLHIQPAQAQQPVQQTVDKPAQPSVQTEQEKSE